MDGREHPNFLVEKATILGRSFMRLWLRTVIWVHQPDAPDVGVCKAVGSRSMKPTTHVQIETGCCLAHIHIE